MERELNQSEISLIHFNNLRASWYQDEKECYVENVEYDWESIDYEPDNIPTEKLEESNYQDLRVIDDFFQSLADTGQIDTKLLPWNKVDQQ